MNLGLLPRALIYVLIISAFMQWPADTKEQQPIGEKADALHYKCEIVSLYTRLNVISREYGEILINEEEAVIFYASTEAASAFSEVRKELWNIYVPASMNEAHQMMIKSVSTYIESAKSIEKALGIYLGTFDGTEDETLELVNEGERQVVLANQYLSESLGMHDKILAFDDDVSKSCRKYVAGL